MDGLMLLGSDTLFTQTVGSMVNYPYTTDKGPTTILGPVLLPKVYGKDLNTIEVGSSGTVALSIYDTHVLTVDSNLNTTHDDGPFNMITMNSRDTDDAIQLRSGATVNKVLLDSFMISENATQNIVSTDKSAGLLLNDVTAISQSLSVETETTLKSFLSVGDDTTMTAMLSVGGESTFDSNVRIEGKTLKIPTGMLTDRPVPTQDYGSIFYNEETNKFEGLHNDSFWRPFGGVIDTDMDTKIEAELTPGEDIDQLHFFANDSNVARMIMTESNLSIALDVQITDTLSVGNAVVLNDTLSVGGNFEITGSVTIEDTLSVDKQVSLNNTLSVAGATYLKNTLSVEGVTDLNSAAILHSTLSVQGAVTIDDILSVADRVVLQNTLSVNAQADFSNTVRIAGDLSVTTNTFVEGYVNFGSTLSVEDTVTLSSNLSVGDYTVLSDTLSVSGNTTLESILSVGNNTVLKQTLSVGQHVQLNSTLSVIDNAYLNNNLSVSGDVEVATASTIFTNAIQTNNGTNTMTLNLGENNDGTLTINGNIDILGAFNNIGVDVTNIQVEDKTITLATGSTPDDVPGGQQYINADGTLNHKSGMIVEGIPDKFDSNHATYTDSNLGNVWEKSFMWNWNEEGNVNGGMQQGPLCTLSNVQAEYSYGDAELTNSYNVENESFWELKGGSLRLSSVIENDDGFLEKISYSMRITKTKELQFVKHEYTNDGVNYTKKVPIQVATFGVSFI